MKGGYNTWPKVDWNSSHERWWNRVLGTSTSIQSMHCLTVTGRQSKKVSISLNTNHCKVQVHVEREIFDRPWKGIFLSQELVWHGRLFDIYWTVVRVSLRGKKILEKNFLHYIKMRTSHSCDMKAFSGYKKSYEHDAFSFLLCSTDVSESITHFIAANGIL